MKTFILFITGSLFVFMSACQSASDINSKYEMSEQEVLELGIFKEDANRKLSRKPTGVVYVATNDQTFKFDFSTDEHLAVVNYKNTHYYDQDQILEGNIFDAFPTVGKLAGYYKRSQLGYDYGWSNYRKPEYFSGEAMYAPIEYALAQECFRDECSTITRKAILQMAIEKHKDKTENEFLETTRARRTGMFLMAIILVKENEIDFITAVRENTDLQNILSMNLDLRTLLNLFTSSKIDDTMCQLSDNFLLNNK